MKQREHLRNANIIERKLCPFYILSMNTKNVTRENGNKGFSFQNEIYFWQNFIPSYAKITKLSI